MGKDGWGANIKQTSEESTVYRTFTTLFGKVGLVHEELDL